MDEKEFMEELDKRDAEMAEGTARGRDETYVYEDQQAPSSIPPLILQEGVALKRIVRTTEHTKVYSEAQRGPGGARHQYAIMARKRDDKPREQAATISFQFGPIAENGVNGCQNEDLLAIVADRLRDFQAGGFACRENAIALKCVKEALHWLEERTRARKRRGVEGRSER